VNDSRSQESPRALFDIGIQILGATAGIASVIYFIGAAVLWVRLQSLGIPADRVVSVIPRETFLAVGILTVFKWGGIALLLLSLALLAYYEGWPWVLGRLVTWTDETSKPGKFLRRLDESRKELRLEAAPGQPPRKVRLPGPEVPRTLISAIIFISLVSFVVVALVSTSWKAVAGSLIGLPIVILLVTENRRRASESGFVSEDEPTFARLEELQQASNAYVQATDEILQLEREGAALKEARKQVTGSADGLDQTIADKEAVLEAARKRSEESTPGYNAFQAWNAVRKARDALGGKDARRLALRADPRCHGFWRPFRPRRRS